MFFILSFFRYIHQFGKYLALYEKFVYKFVTKSFPGIFPEVCVLKNRKKFSKLPWDILFHMWYDSLMNFEAFGKYEFSYETTFLALLRKIEFLRTFPGAHFSEVCRRENLKKFPDPPWSFPFRST